MKLWLTGVPTGEKQMIPAIRGIQECAKALEGVELATVAGARKCYHTLRNPETATIVLMGATDEEPRMRQAVASLQSGDCEFELANDDHIPDFDPAQKRPERPLPEGENPGLTVDQALPSYDSSAVAAILLVAGDGNISNAIGFANSLKRATGDSIFEETVAFLIDTFPADPTSERLADRLAAAAQTGESDPKTEDDDPAGS
jgi:hypothetical protein